MLRNVLKVGFWVSGFIVAIRVGKTILQGYDDVQNVRQFVRDDVPPVLSSVWV